MPRHLSSSVSHFSLSPYPLNTFNLLHGFMLCRATMAVFGGANLGSVSFSSHLFEQQSCFLSCPLRLLPSSSSSSSSSSSRRNSLLCVVKSFSGSATADTDRNSDQSSVISASNSLLRDTSDDAGTALVRTHLLFF